MKNTWKKKKQTKTHQTTQFHRISPLKPVYSRHYQNRPQLEVSKPQNNELRIHRLKSPKDKDA